jgi:hypothetical protein
VNYAGQGERRTEFSALPGIPPVEYQGEQKKDRSAFSVSAVFPSALPALQSRCLSFTVELVEIAFRAYFIHGTSLLWLFVLYSINDCMNAQV